MKNLLLEQPTILPDDKEKGFSDQVLTFSENSFLSLFADAVPNVLLVLNPSRQIVFGNASSKKLAQKQGDNILGKRPGELLRCAHLAGSKDGCGTTEFCTFCGGNKALLEAQKEGVQSVKECRIVTAENENFDFRVMATPFDSVGERMTIYFVEDIKAEKRRMALEKIFFHDVMNVAMGISGFSEMIQDERDSGKIAELSELISLSTSRLVEEIQSHKDLIKAEHGDLKLSTGKISSGCLLEELKCSCRHYERLEGQKVVVSPDSQEVNFESDVVLLRRVLGNMLKNALEASPMAEEVRISARKDDHGVIFNVWNPTPMSRDVQLQIFQRSFSTKGTGRGIGTYSMKLLGEHYLKGKVGFNTSEKGTNFHIALPLSI